MPLDGNFDTTRDEGFRPLGSTESPRREYELVWCITERNGREFWTKVGVSFVNRDGSRNLFLDAVPMNGKLQVRKPSEEHSPPRRGFDFGRRFTEEHGE